MTGPASARAGDRILQLAKRVWIVYRFETSDSVKGSGRVTFEVYRRFGPKGRKPPPERVERFLDHALQLLTWGALAHVTERRVKTAVTLAAKRRLGYLGKWCKVRSET